MRSRTMAGLACATLLAVAACSGDTSAGEPTTAQSESASAQADGLPKHGAPPVPAPLDISGITNDPCSALTEQQTDAFPGKLAETRVGETTLTGEGKSCSWIFHGDRYSLGGFSGGVVLPSPQYQGLSSLYKGKQRGAMDTFRSVGPIGGYPAVIYASGRSIGDGFCRLAVGLRDDTAYRVNTELSSNHPAEQDPCQVARKLAKFVVKNLKEGR